ncbi:hypothetical protein [Curvibacter lanceolatus]|uniref:hypothetical protein n=1 Tax=Curvibacter lanceolatus TaxID=86182 RepID=UPI0012F85650|nr:hypothetical protein [Curvibacter lanceolatus]
MNIQSFLVIRQDCLVIRISLIENEFLFASAHLLGMRICKFVLTQWKIGVKMPIVFVRQLLSRLNGPEGKQPISSTKTSKLGINARPLERLPALGVVFLDFDGVLHSGTSGTFALLPKFEDLLTIHPGIDIVISST